MAWMGLLAEVRPPVDADYVVHFQRLADLNLEMKAGAPTKGMLLRRSILEAAVGNYHSSHQAAQDAVLLDPDDADSQHRLGVSCLFLAYVEAGAVACSRSDEPRRRVGLRGLLDDARVAFAEAARACPGDEESAQLAKGMEHLLRRPVGEVDLLALLRGESEGPGGRRDRPQRLRGGTG